MRTRLRGPLLSTGLLLALAAAGCAPPASTGSSPSPAALTVPASSSASSSGTVAPTSSGTVLPTSSGTVKPGSSGTPVTSGPGRVASPLPACKNLRTVTAGTLTLVAGDRSAAPWFTGDPAAGKGFEAAVGVAVAAELGYPTDRVVWKRADPASVLAGRATGFDAALGEFAVPDTTSATVDYSTGYFSISQSLVARAGSPAAGLPSTTTLRTLRVASTAAARGDEAAAAVRYPSAAAALAALTAGKVDAALIPTPDAVTAGKGFVVVGQLSDPTEQPPQFGMVLPHRSPLTSCVSAAIDQLRVTGVLADLVSTWVPAAARPLG